MDPRLSPVYGVVYNVQSVLVVLNVTFIMDVCHMYLLIMAVIVTKLKIISSVSPRLFSLIYFSEEEAEISPN